MASHIRHLLTSYGHISIIWFDGLLNHKKYDPERFHRLIRELSPETLFNDRLGDRYDFITPEQFIPTRGVPTRTREPQHGESGGEWQFRVVATRLKKPGRRRSSLSGISWRL
jgi:hypothetical protein